MWKPENPSGANLNYSVFLLHSAKTICKLFAHLQNTMVIRYAPGERNS